jgi:hypothetical protein
MKLIRLACAAGVVLVSGGCAADALTSSTPRPAPPAAASIQSVLAGRAGGIRLTSGAAVPGGGVRIRCRPAGRPFPAGSEPLYVIDGVPLSQDEMVAAGIDPTRIADIRVMKAPAAVETYGLRGKNGALLITTRRE